MSLAWSTQAPRAQEYVALRAACGLGARTLEAARIGLRHHLFCVTLRDGDRLVGMARLVGDGGCFVELVDVTIAPSHRGRGLGRDLVRRCLDWAQMHLPESCFLSLIAAPGAQSLYAKAGFEPYIGMGLHIE